MTLSEFAEGFYDVDGTFMQDRLARGYHYSLKLAKSNNSALKRHVLEYLGDRPVYSITSTDVNKWLLELPKKANICNKTANTQLSILRDVLDEAVRQGIVQTNVADAVKPLNKNTVTTERQTNRVAFTVEQVRDLFAVQWKNHLAMVACMLAAGTGMRIGEVRALKVEQIHDDYIEVNANIAEQEGRKCTKSTWSRTVPLDMGLRYILGSVMPEEGYVFTINGVKPVGKNWIARVLYAEMGKRGIKAKEGEQLSFHSFRHYFNTRLIAGNIKSEKIRAVIGHETEDMTEHYAHLEPSDMEEIRSVQRLALGL